MNHRVLASLSATLLALGLSASASAFELPSLAELLASRSPRIGDATPSSRPTPSTSATRDEAQPDRATTGTLTHARLGEPYFIRVLDLVR